MPSVASCFALHLLPMIICSAVYTASSMILLEMSTFPKVLPGIPFVFIVHIPSIMISTICPSPFSLSAIDQVPTLCPSLSVNDFPPTDLKVVNNRTITASSLISSLDYVEEVCPSPSRPALFTILSLPALSRT